MSREDGAHKIGFSRRPESRTGQVRSREQQRVELVFWVRPSSDARLVERDAQRALRDHALGREWFSVDEMTAIEAVIGSCSAGIETCSTLPCLVEWKMRPMSVQGFKKALARAQEAQTMKEAEDVTT